jgi:hypothetical protein
MGERAGRIRAAWLCATIALAATACGPTHGGATGPAASTPTLDEADAAARGYLDAVPEISDEIGKLTKVELASPGGVWSGHSADGDTMILTYRLKGPRGAGKAKVWVVRGEIAWTPVGCRARVRSSDPKSPAPAKTVRAGREPETTVSSDDVDRDLL